MTFSPVLQDAACVLTVWFCFDFFFLDQNKFCCHPFEILPTDTVVVFVEKKRVGKGR